MINALSGAAEKIPAPTRLSGEEVLKRRELPQSSVQASARTTALAFGEVDSAVVEISSEGSRRAQTKAAAPSVPSQPPQDVESSAAALTSTQLGLELPVPLSTGPTSPRTELVSAAAKQDDTNEASEFDEADANQDGTVNVLERRAFDFMHPSLERYPGSKDEQTPRAIAAELKAYEEVARSGRNL